MTAPSLAYDGRVLFAGWRYQLKTLLRSSFFVMSSLVQPIGFATLANYMFRAGHRPSGLVYASIGAALLGIWSATLFGSGTEIQRQRRWATLELLVISPARFDVVLVSFTLAVATLGVYSLVATLAWGRLVFGIDFGLAHPVAFLVGLASTVLALGALGLVLASTFVHYRNANALSNMLEYPVWLMSGFFVPLSLLPVWTRPLSFALAPSWGVRAIRAAVFGGSPWGPVAATLGLALGYLALGRTLVGVFERRARRSATLTLS